MYAAKLDITKFLSSVVKYIITGKCVHIAENIDDSYNLYAKNQFLIRFIFHKNIVYKHCLLFVHSFIL